MADPFDSETEYRIEYTITRRRGGEDDFTEIGFGSSGAWSDVDQCAYALGSDIQLDSWETEPGQPNPSTVRDDIRTATSEEAGRG